MEERTIAVVVDKFVNARVVAGRKRWTREFHRVAQLPVIRLSIVYSPVIVLGGFRVRSSRPPPGNQPAQ
jgi:hypothetical protein